MSWAAEKCRGCGLFAAGLGVSLLLALGSAERAAAHGGLPLTSQILWRNNTLLVPSLQWGIFVGSVTGPWSWICDEAINTNLLRQISLGGDGTLYATAAAGVTVSHDNGCTWGPAPGAVSGFKAALVATDAVAPSRVWVAATTTQVELWRSDDAAQTFSQSYALPGYSLAGLAVHPDGMTLHLGVLSLAAPPQPAVYTSSDGGATFLAHPLSGLPPDLTLPQISLLASDPRNAAVVYLRCDAASSEQVLFRADLSAGTVSELLRTTHLIYSVAVDPARDRLYIAAADGVHYADGSATVQPSPGLSYARCFSVQGDKLYACANNYPPDSEAVALSSDGGQSFTKVFRFSDTQGVLSCPAGSGVATLCPAIWAGYSSELADNPGMLGWNPDLGQSDASPGGIFNSGPLPSMGAAAATAGCGCSVGGREQELHGGQWAGLGLLLGVFLFRLRRHADSGRRGSPS